MKNKKTTAKKAPKIPPPQVVVLKNPIDAKMKILQTIADANETFSEAQADFVQMQRELITKVGGISLLEVKGSNHTIQNCVFQAEAETGVSFTDE